MDRRKHAICRGPVNVDSLFPNLESAPFCEPYRNHNSLVMARIHLSPLELKKIDEARLRKWEEKQKQIQLDAAKEPH